MSCYCVESAKAFATWGKWSFAEKSRDTQPCKKLGVFVMVFTISSLLLEASDDLEKMRRLQPSILLHVLETSGAKLLSSFIFRSHLGRTYLFSQEAVCQVRQQYYDSPMQKTLAPLKPKSIKEFQGQRINDTARPAQVYLAKCIYFCKRSTACLQCFWRPGSQKGNPKLTHTLAHNCLRLDDFLHLPVIISLTYGWLPLSSKCLLVQWELSVVLWQTSD